VIRCINIHSILLNLESGKEQKTSELMAVKMFGAFRRGGFIVPDKAQLRELVILGSVLLP
jgi:hypothetical protein